MLAAGLVLGVGGAVTLAAWNDSEYATGTFAACTFNMQGSTDGTVYADHATSGAAVTLPFTVAPTNLSPGATVYSPFAVRLAAGTTTGASVAVQAVTNTGTVTNPTYTLVTSTSITCNAAAVTAATGSAMLPPPDRRDRTHAQLCSSVRVAGHSRVERRVRTHHDEH